MGDFLVLLLRYFFDIFEGAINIFYLLCLNEKNYIKIIDLLFKSLKPKERQNSLLRTQRFFFLLEQMSAQILFEKKKETPLGGAKIRIIKNNSVMFPLLSQFETR